MNVLERHGVGQSAQMLLPPIALHSPGDGGLVVRTPVVTESGERHRITLTCEARTEDREPRHPGDVADDVRSLAMHLGERLLPRLDVLARLGEEHGALAEGTAPHADVVRRPERPGEQPKGMEALDPLAVMPIACGPTPHGLDLLRIDQAYLDATRLAQRTERDPRDPGGCHGDGRDLALRHPVCQGCEVSRVGGKAAHRWGIITGGGRPHHGLQPRHRGRRRGGWRPPPAVEGWAWNEPGSAGVGPWSSPQEEGEEQRSGRGRGRGGIAALFQTGPGHRLSPLMAPRTPGTSLTNGHKAPLVWTASHDPLLPRKYSADRWSSSFPLDGCVSGVRAEHRRQAFRPVSGEPNTVFVPGHRART